jgi:hypothetical protein
MKTIRPVELLCFVCICLGVLVGLWRGIERGRVERANRQVEILLDWAEVERTATLSGKPVEEVMRTFKDAGATSVALTEDSIGELESERQITVYPGLTARSTKIVGNPEVLARLALWLKNRLPGAATLVTQEPRTLRINLPYSQVRGQGVGLDQNLLQKIRASGLKVIGRVANTPGMGADRVGFTLRSLGEQNIKTVIFSGDSVMGFKDLLKPSSEPDSIARLLSENKIQYGFVEFGKQKGDEVLSKQVADQLVRVHTITKEEMNTAGKDESIQRFLLAARERNLRVLFVRFFWDEGDVLASNAQYIEKIKEGLERSKSVILKIGGAQPYSHLELTFPWRFLLSLAVGGALSLLMHALTGILEPKANRKLQIVTLGLFLAMPALSLLDILGAKLLALLAACIFPALGLIQKDLLVSRRKDPMFAAFARFGRATFWTILGIICITGLLSDRLFMVKAESFMGIKASNFAPILLCAVAYAAGIRHSSGHSLRQNIKAFRQNIIQIATEPLRLWQVVIALVVLALLGMLWIRSGNDASGAVSGFEMKLRGLQDRFLPARPRFKEYLIFPVLFAAFYLAAEGRTPRWVLVPLLIFGAIAEGSLLNTFCHIHTPLSVGLWRAGLGIVIGLVLGVVLCLLIRWTRHLVHPPSRLFAKNNPGNS